jgi:transposase InsO family protein
VARWRARQDVADRSTRPHRLTTPITDWEEALIIELRRSLALPLDDLVEAMRRCVNPKLSRSGIHRCLKRHHLAAHLTPDKAPPGAFQTDVPAGFIHIDVKYLPPLGRRRGYAYVAIDRATRFVYLEILSNRRAATAAGFLERFLDRFPLRVHTILTDNGSQFTDRFAVDKKAKPPDKPSGTHAFDQLCAARAITHRLTQPFRPQSNGMVERFNRRLGEHLDRLPQNRTAHHRRFRDHAERDAYLHTFVADYNHTRLRCLDYQAPAELLAKLAGHNTCAGAGLYGALVVKGDISLDHNRVVVDRLQLLEVALDDGRYLAARVDHMSFKAVRPQPASQPEAVAPGFISDRYPVDIAPRLLRFAAPTIQQPQQSFLVRGELLHWLSLDPRDNGGDEPARLAHRDDGYQCANLVESGE